MSFVALLCAVAALGGCTYTSHVALLSRGNLVGKELTNVATGQMLEGRECGLRHNLSTAFDDAVKGTSYDTLTDVDVTSTTGIFNWSNCIEVKGHAVRSADLPQGQGK